MVLLLSQQGTYQRDTKNKHDGYDETQDAYHPQVLAILLRESRKVLFCQTVNRLLEELF